MAYLLLPTTAFNYIMCQVILILFNFIFQTKLFFFLNTG